MRTLDLALIGNGRIGLLVDSGGAVVWGCFPRFDGDPTFCALLDTAPAATTRGVFTIELINGIRVEQEYLVNTAVLVTRLYDSAGGTIEITDCVPRFLQFGRVFQPTTLVRRISRIAGSPRVLVRLRPAFDYGRRQPTLTIGSNHVRYVGPEMTIRLTTNASLTAVVEERSFILDRDLTLLLGSDEPVTRDPSDVGRHFTEETARYWRDWVRRLAIPFEWQSPVIRAAMSLQLNAYDDTGAIVAAMTTSIPEAADSGRNWDYRYCWLRDSYFVIDALNRLGATETMERYLGYIVNIAAAGDKRLQPVYGISGNAMLAESTLDSLPGYRGMGPVRIGNDAHRQIQNDVYGATVLSAAHVFFDERLGRRGDSALFERLEPLGRHAIAMHDQPDAGPWEFRETERVHTFSSVMCWAACDRLARIARRLALPEHAGWWRDQAQRIRIFIETNCWNEHRRSFVGAVGAESVDAALLLLADLGFVLPADPRFSATVETIGRDLKRGSFILRYADRDDFGEPMNAFVVCTYWYVNALALLGRREEARELFEHLLTLRNRHGLFAEHLDTETGEPWGNYVQTYSMVGLITSAIRLSHSWDSSL